MTIPLTWIVFPRYEKQREHTVQTSQCQYHTTQHHHPNVRETHNIKNGGTCGKQYVTGNHT